MELQAYADPARLPASAAMRVAKLLEIEPPGAESEVQLALSVSDGLLPRSAQALARLLGASRVIGPMIPEATLRRARKAGKPLSRAHSERLYEVGRVVDAVSCAYRGDRNAIEMFLGRAHPLLEGITPLDLARSGSAGTEAVLNLIRRAQAGMAV